MYTKDLALKTFYVFYGTNKNTIQFLYTLDPVFVGLTPFQELQPA